MQDVPIGETESLAGQATVPGPVVVKESPGKAKQNNQYINSLLQECLLRMHCKTFVVFV